jgi:hypothetical protein
MKQSGQVTLPRLLLKRIGDQALRKAWVGSHAVDALRWRSAPVKPMLGVAIGSSVSSPTQSATDRRVGLWKVLAWTDLLLAGALYVVGPLEPLVDPTNR